MVAFIRAALFSGFCLAITACDRVNDANPAALAPEIAVVNGVMEAYNRHDPAAMRAFFHDDVVWYEIYGGSITPVTASASELEDELEKYFAAFPDVSSSLENPTVSGKYVTAVERPVWEVDGKRKSQSSVVVYEIVDGRVKRFWYFPSQ